MVTLTGNAGLEEVTMHVLRHSYATVAHELGYSELTIAGLLGHRLGSVTSRYAHHVDHALADAADWCGLQHSQQTESTMEKLLNSLQQTSAFIVCLAWLEHLIIFKSCLINNARPSCCL